MKIIDTHCDVLYKLQRAKKQGKLLQYKNDNTLDCNLERLQTGKIMVQFFAIFIDPIVHTDQAWKVALEQIKLFQSEIIAKHPEIIQITSWKQFDQLNEEKIGAVLTLEGAEAFGNDLNKLKTLYDLGVMSIGLTWNHANLCADGVMEPRGGGLTLLGKEVAALNNKYQVLTDVSHLSERGFWDVLEWANYPFASHSNTKKICNHPRNLNDDQIKALIQKDAPIHLVFYPDFTKETGMDVTINDLLKHIEHICSLGGVNHIGFGSDFDGIDKYIHNLENAATYQYLMNELLKYYTEDEVKGFAYQNFLSKRPQ